MVVTTQQDLLGDPSHKEQASSAAAASRDEDRPSDIDRASAPDIRTRSQACDPAPLPDPAE